MSDLDTPQARQARRLERLERRAAEAEPVADGLRAQVQAVLKAEAPDPAVLRDLTTAWDKAERIVRMADLAAARVEFEGERRAVARRAEIEDGRRADYIARVRCLDWPHWCRERIADLMVRAEIAEFDQSFEDLLRKLHRLSWLGQPLPPGFQVDDAAEHNDTPEDPPEPEAPAPKPTRASRRAAAAAEQARVEQDTIDRARRQRAARDAALEVPPRPQPVQHTLGYGPGPLRGSSFNLARMDTS